jgi:pimeloyl-ACP methyl ester carboxylesterase
MPSRRGVLKGGAIAAGAVGALAGLAFAGEKIAVGRLRKQPDPDRGEPFTPPFDEIRSLRSHDGGSISVISRGSGPPIVLSHGVTLSVRTWAKQMRSLPEQGFEVFAFDHRGHGQSTVGESGHSLDGLAWDVRSVLEGLDLRGAVLVGHSMGGIAVQAFATQFPDVAAERVAGIVLLSTLARTYTASAKRLQAVLTALSNRTPDLGSVMERRDLGYLAARLGFGRDPQPSHVELTRQMIAECRPETSHGAAIPLLGLDLTDDLPKIDIPTLVIAGNADLVTPLRENKRISQLIPGARLEVFDGGGHMLMLERAADVDRLIVDFAHEVQLRSAAEPFIGHSSRS